MADDFKSKLPKALIVFRALIKNNEGKFLFLKRSDYRNWLNFKWEPPGGRLKIDEDISSLLEREILEETSLKIKPDSQPFYSQLRMCVDYKDIPAILVFFMSTIVSGDIKLSNEHTEYRWVDLKEAAALD